MNLPAASLEGSGRGKAKLFGPASSAAALAERFAKLLNKEIISATIGKNFVANEAMVQNDPSLKKYIFIEPRTEPPAHAVLGHKLSHHIESASPRIFNDLYQALTRS